MLMELPLPISLFLIQLCMKTPGWCSCSSPGHLLWVYILNYYQTNLWKMLMGFPRSIELYFFIKSLGKWMTDAIIAACVNSFRFHHSNFIKNLTRMFLEPIGLIPLQFWLNSLSKTNGKCSWQFPGIFQASLLNHYSKSMGNTLASRFCMIMAMTQYLE